MSHITPGMESRYGCACGSPGNDNLLIVVLELSAFTLFMLYVLYTLYTSHVPADIPVGVKTGGSGNKQTDAALYHIYYVRSCIPGRRCDCPAY